MREQYPTSSEDDGFVKFNGSVEDFFKAQNTMNSPDQNSNVNQAAQQQQPKVYRTRNMPRTQTPQAAPQEQPEIKRGPKQKRARGIVAGTVALAAVVGGGAFVYTNNIGGIQDMVKDWDIGQAQAIAGGLETSDIEFLGPQSLELDQCKEPEAVLMHAIIDVEMPLVPLLIAATIDDTPTGIPAYLTETIKDAQPIKNQAQFEELITDDGYSHSTTSGLLMGLTACKVSLDKEATSNQGGNDGALTINRSAIQIEFQPIDSLFPEVVVKSMPQVDGIDNLTLNAEKFEYISFPNSPSLYLGKSATGDVIYDTYFDEMTTAMATPEQQNIVRAMMEAQAVNEIKKSVNGSDEISFPDADVVSFREAIDRALMQRFAGRESTEDDIFNDDNYVISINTPKDPITKIPITDNDSTGASPLVRLDPTQQIIVNKIEIKNGSIKSPADSLQGSTDAISNE